MVQTSTTTAPDAPSRPADPHAANAPDPLAGLYKMSATVNQATQIYVAVNSLAVAAVMLGIASALSFVHITLLAVPLVGIVCGIVALRQIARSGGTQTGRGVAVAGLALCVLLGGGRLTRDLLTNIHDRAETKLVVAQVDKLQNALKQENYAEAYKLFSDDFHAEYGPDEFADTFRNLTKPTRLGPVHEIKWNGVLPLFQSVTLADQGEAPICVMQMLMSFKNQEATAAEYVSARLIKVDGEWRFQELSDLFPHKNKPGEGEAVLDQGDTSSQGQTGASAGQQGRSLRNATGSQQR